MSHAGTKSMQTKNSKGKKKGGTRVGSGTLVRPTCDRCGRTGDLKRGWTNAFYCSATCERLAVSFLHGTMPGAGPVPYRGWVPGHIENEIARRWA